MTPFRYAMFFIALTMLSFLVPAQVIAAEPNPPASTDDELRKSLEAESMQDYDRELLGDASAKSKEKSPASQGNNTKPGEESKPPAEALPERLKRELGPAAQSESAGKPPMAKVVEAMRGVQPRLAKCDAGETTQHIEDQIVRDLDQLVEQARKSCCGGQCNKPSDGKKPSGSKNSSSPTASNQKIAAPHENPSQSSNEKRTASLPSNAENAHDLHSLVKRLWGELPEIERQQMLALPDEEFLPQYEEQTKQYLRRLSDGKPMAERQP